VSENGAFGLWCGSPGSYFASFLEQRRMVEEALVAVIQRACINDV
jgi:hypothetical protein